AVRYSLQHGYSASTAANFMAYAIMLEVGFQDYDSALSIGNFCMQIVDKFEDMRARTRIYVGVVSGIYHWKLPYREYFPKILKAYALGRQSGELLYACYAITVTLQLMIAQGDELDDILSRHKNLSNLFGLTSFLDILFSSRIFEIITLVLKGDKS